MRCSRREVLQYAGLSGGGLLLPAVESSCLISRPESRVLPSRLPLPKPFQVSLRILPILKPTRTDSSADFYNVTVRQASAQILDGMNTTIWGYDGVFPGPTIEASVGRRVSLRLQNALSVPIVNHLHGGRTAPENDGYPTD